MKDRLIEQQLKETFIWNMVHMRKGRGLTQREFAELMKVKISSVGAWEELRAFPTIGHVIQICDYFGIEIRTFLTVKLKPRSIPPSDPESGLKDNFVCF